MSKKKQTNKSCKIPLIFSIVGIISNAWSSAKLLSPSWEVLVVNICLTLTSVSFKWDFKLSKWLRHCFLPALITILVPVLQIKVHRFLNFIFHSFNKNDFIFVTFQNLFLYTTYS